MNEFDLSVLVTLAKLSLIMILGEQLFVHFCRTILEIASNKKTDTYNNFSLSGMIISFLIVASTAFCLYLILSNEYTYLTLMTSIGVTLVLMFIEELHRGKSLKKAKQGSVDSASN